MDDCYIYLWYNEDWGDIPFYVGKGRGNRYCSKSGRSVAFTNFTNRWKCSSRIIFDGLSEEIAESLERALKERFIMEGYPIIDAEVSYRKKVSQKVAIENARKRGVKFGRPALKIDDFQKFLKKQKDGELSVKECCEALGISRATWYNKLKEVC